MTPDDPLRSISADLDETIVQLDALHAPLRARQTDYLAQLRAVVARLDQPGLPDEPEQAIERPQRNEPRRPTRAEREHEISDEDLPQRKTSRGGPWGPAMKAKLTRLALDREPW